MKEVRVYLSRMKTFVVIVVAAALLSSLHARPRESRETFDFLKKGRDLSPKDAEKLEESVKKNPDNEEARIQLLSYYAAPKAGADLSAVKAARASHILWLIENDPKDGLGLFQVITGVYRVHCDGDELADPETFKRASEIWLSQIKKNPKDAEIRRRAVDAIKFCSPEQAEQILTEGKDRSGLGTLYATAALGITGQSYLNSDPAGSDPKLRERAFAVQAREILQEAKDKDLVVAAAGTMLREGAILWADGKLDWDYTPLGNSLLVKAKSLAPDNMMLLTLPTAPPGPGQRPPGTMRIGGNAQERMLVHKVTPSYPPIVRNMGIQGVVQMTALIGLDGKILQVHPEAGPEELIPGSIEAVRQWEYKPTLLNGKPCFVITRIDVNYKLSAR